MEIMGMVTAMTMICTLAARSRFHMPAVLEVRFQNSGHGLAPPYARDDTNDTGSSALIQRAESRYIRDIWKL